MPLRTFGILIFLGAAILLFQRCSSPQSDKPCQVYLDSANAYAQSFDEVEKLRQFAILTDECARSKDNDTLRLEALSMIGVSYFREGNYQEALNWFESGRDLANQVGDRRASALTGINIGNTMINLDSVPKAMLYMTEAVEILESLNDSVNLSAVYNSMAHIMGKVGNEPQRLEYSSRAFAFSGGDFSNKFTLRLAVNYAVNLSNNGMRDSSEALSLKILSASKAIGYTKSLTQVLNHLANLSLKKDEPESALKYAMECLSYETNFNHPITFNTAYTHLGMAYLVLDSLPQSIDALEKARQYGRVENTLIAKRKPLAHLHEAYQRQGMWSEAYVILVEYKALSDSLLQEENVRIVNELKEKYESEKKEQQLNELNRQHEINTLQLEQSKIWFVVLVVLSLVIALAIYFTWRQRILKQEQQAIENRLVSLRVQLNPHFIFNALTAVQNYMLGGKDLKEAIRYLSNFAKVMRAFLEYNRYEWLSLDKELEAIRLYVEIQKMRFQDGFEFDVRMDENLDSEEVQVPPMILQPLLENAIEHGIRNVSDGRIELSYELIDDKLVMSLRDNGVGRKKAALANPKTEEKTSLATKITKERLQLLNRQNKGHFSLAITDAQSDGSGTEVTVVIPFKVD